MHWQYTPYALPLVAAAAVSATLALYGWHRRPAPGATFFALLVLAVSEWSLTYALELDSADLSAKILFDALEFFGIVVIPAAWLALTLCYTGREKWLSPRNLALLAVEPVIVVLLVWTNGFHGLIWGDVGLDTSGTFINLSETPRAGFWVHTVYSYTLLLIGVLLLIQTFVRAPRLYRRQLISLLVGVLVPWLANALSLLDLSPFPEFDLTPFAFTVSGAVMAWGLFRFRLLDIVPVARSAVVDSLSDGVIVLDTQNRIVDINPAAQRIIRRAASEAIGQSAAEVFSARPDLVEEYRNVTEVNAEIVLPGPVRSSQASQEQEQRSFELRILPLYDRRGALTGRLIVLRDITERKQAEEALRNAEAATLQRLKEQTALREAGSIISSTLDLPTVLSRIAEQMGQLVEVTSVYIYNYELGKGTATVLATYVAPQAGAHDRVADLDTTYYLPHDLPGLVEPLLAGQPKVFHMDDPGLAASERAYLDDRGARTMLVVPLQIKAQVNGYAELHESRTRRDFTADEIALCQSIAQQAAIALENARLYEEARRHATDMGILYTIAHMAARSLMLEDVLSQSLSAVLLLLDFEAGVIGLEDAQDGRLRLMVEQKLPSVLSRRLQRGGLENTPLAYVHDQRKSMILASTDLQSPPALRQMADEMATLGLHTCVYIPLLHQDQSLGVMGLFTRHLRAFSTDEMTFLDTIGRQIAAAVANAALFRAIADERSRLKALIESSRDGIMMIGTDQRLLVTNATALKLLRLPGDPADWMDKSVRETLAALRRHAPEAVRATLAELRRIKKGDEPFAEGEYEVPPRTIHWLNLPVETGGVPMGRLLVLYDVTEVRVLERMRDDLTRTLIHDLRNPLTTISTSLQFLEQLSSSFSPDQSFMLEIARSSTRKMLKLINTILDVSQLESGRMPLRYEPVSLAELVDEALRLHMPQAAGKGVRLENSVPQSLPPAWADARLVERVLQNLIDNAIRFTPVNGLVHVMAMQTDGGPSGPEKSGQPAPVSELHVSVSNNGPGLSPEVQDRLFQKFVTGGEQGSGTGLGLAFCKLAVEAHGGHIWVESEPDEITTFTFTLPLAGPDSEQADWLE
jgi:NtrC-family two-component system sensor histidine kinase KinB